MCKTVIFFIFVMASVVSSGRLLNGRSSNIHRLPSSIDRSKVGLDFCPECINEADEAISVLLNLVLNEGIVASCGDLCGALANKTGSKISGIICDLACEAVGIIEFDHLLTNLDIDPIWYCQLAKICPSKMKDFFFFHYFIEIIYL
jgi:hypothetical protein